MLTAILRPTLSPPANSPAPLRLHRRRTTRPRQPISSKLLSARVSIGIHSQTLEPKMRTNDLQDLLETLELVRKEKHPDVDPAFLVAVVRAEEQNPEDDQEA